MMIRRATSGRVDAVRARCRAGIQGSGTDFLTCAVAARYDFAIFTVDDNFHHFAKVLSIALHAISA